MFDWLWRKLGVDAAAQQRKADLLQALEVVIDGCDGRLRLLPGYQPRMLPGISRALDYLAGLPWQSIAPLELSLHAFSSDRRLGLLFASPLSLLLFLKSSAELSTFFHSASQGDEAWAIMSMNRSETMRFGMVEHNGEIRSDVAQRVVSFDQHRLFDPSASQQALQSSTSHRGLTVLVAVIDRHLKLQQQMRLDLLAELEQVQLRLATFGHGKRKVIDATGSADGGVANLPADEDGLRRRERELQAQLQPLAGLTELSGVLDAVCQVLQQPEAFLHIEAQTIYLNRMGVRHDRLDADDITALCYEHVVLGLLQPISRALMPVYVHRQHLRELEQQFADELASLEQQQQQSGLF